MLEKFVILSQWSLKHIVDNNNKQVGDITTEAEGKLHYVGKNFFYKLSILSLFCHARL